MRGEPKIPAIFAGLILSSAAAIGLSIIIWRLMR